MVFGKLALQIKRRPEVIAPEAARPALNAYKIGNVSELLRVELLYAGCLINRYLLKF